MICSPLLLHSEEGQFTAIGSRLQEAQLGHNKEQDATTSNWRSDRQTKGDKILQQA